MNFAYTFQYNSPYLKGKDNSKKPRPWDLNQEIILQSKKTDTLLDIGCGSCQKLIPFVPYLKKIIGIDISESLLNVGRQLNDQKKIANIELILADSHKLPFKNHFFDIVTCMLSTWKISEIIRILKPNGKVIIEHVGGEDKLTFKKFFGKDSNGWRGQFLNYIKNEHLDNLHQLLKKYFKNVTIKNGYWQTYYTKKGLLDLLYFTPTIRNFNFKKDYRALEKAIKHHQTSQGILLTQNRILIHANNI